MIIINFEEKPIHGRIIH